jgi:O-antigen/teichoic acid export membrane protein
MTRSYLIFLILQITSTIFENIAVARHADKMYPYLREKNNEKLDYDTVAEIKKNTGAMVLHKMGGIVVGSTDNILISIKVGIEWVGLYSNYQLIISALNTVIGQLFTAITASVGNLGAIETKEKSLNIFECINFAGFWVFGVCSISLYYLINPFIEIWLGIDLLMSMNVVTILVTNFFIQGMRKSVLTFREAFGLYWYDRHKPLFESIINLISSVLLAKKFGITGIFIGTLISTLTTCFWIEPYVLYKKGFDSPLKPYFVKYTIYVAATMIAWLLTGLGINIIKGATIFSFIFKTIICLSIPNLLYTILFSRTKEFNYFWKLVKNIYNKVFKKY